MPRGVPHKIEAIPQALSFCVLFYGFEPNKFAVAGFWMLLKIYVFNSGPDPRNRPNRPGKLAPDPPDIVEQPQEIVDFRSWSGGPVGHP